MQGWIQSRDKEQSNLRSGGRCFQRDVNPSGEPTTTLQNSTGIKVSFHDAQNSESLKLKIGCVIILAVFNLKPNTKRLMEVWTTFFWWMAPQVKCFDYSATAKERTLNGKGTQLTFTCQFAAHSFYSLLLHFLWNLFSRSPSLAPVQSCLISKGSSTFPAPYLVIITKQWPWPKS